MIEQLMEQHLALQAKLTAAHAKVSGIKQQLVHTLEHLDEVMPGWENA